jgi:hypothetical protein
MEEKYFLSTKKFKWPCQMWKYYGKVMRVIIGLIVVKGLSKSGAETIITECERNGVLSPLKILAGGYGLGGMI